METTILQYVPLVLVVVVLSYFVYRDRVSHKAASEEPSKPAPAVKIALPPVAPSTAPALTPVPAEPRHEERQPEAQEVEKEVDKAKVALETAGVKGKERLDTIAAVRRREVTGDEVVEAHKK